VHGAPDGLQRRALKVPGPARRAERRAEGLRRPIDAGLRERRQACSSGRWHLVRRLASIQRDRG
jgi:hypothetical protein